MGFFIALAGMERGALFSGGVSCAALRQVFLYRHSKQRGDLFHPPRDEECVPLNMGSLSARRDYDIIYTTMSAPLARRWMTSKLITL